VRKEGSNAAWLQQGSFQLIQSIGSELTAMNSSEKLPPVVWRRSIWRVALESADSSDS
jgi:hypothetical protein